MLGKELGAGLSVSHLTRTHTRHSGASQDSEGGTCDFSFLDFSCYYIDLRMICDACDAYSSRAGRSALRR